MARTRHKWVRVSEAEKCKICSKPDWCCVSQDGKVAYCMRIESDKPVKSSLGTGWIHKLDQPIEARGPEPVTKRKTDVECHAKWAPIVAACEREAEEPVKRLAIQLGVSVWALSALRVGYGHLGNRWCWTFPEWNQDRQVLGINRRLVNPIAGKKHMFVKGGRRGLIYAEDWDTYGGPIVVVEGGSDVAAALTLGLCVIGRPSVGGGTALLVKLIQQRRGRIIVVAERDRKKHDDLPPLVKRRHDPRCRGCMACWPGKAGAMAMAKELKTRVGQSTEWQFMPDGAKDMRAWLNLQEGKPEDMETMFRVGKTLFGQE